MTTIVNGTWQDNLPNRINALITDPPYNTTQCSWDGGFSAQEFWEALAPKLEPVHTVIFTCQMRLAVDLVKNSPTIFRHDLVWEKPNGTGQVRRSPNRCHELILVFGTGPYYPQMTEGKPYRWNSSRSRGEATGYSGSGEINNTGTRHPRSVMRVAQQRGLHPTQKPVELFEFLIRSYTEPDWCVVDPFAGSGTTGIAAQNTGRDYYLVEAEQDYYEIAKSRLT